MKTRDKFYFTLLVMSLIVIICIRCAPYTPYQPVGMTGGYSEMQLDSNRFTVSFKGNGYTSVERATDLCLLRCAELCKVQGFNYFIIVDSKEEIRESTYKDNVNTQSNYTVYNYGNSATIQGTKTTSGGTTHIIQKPGVRNTIVCYRGQPKSDEITVYKPTYLISSIKTKYSIVEKK